MTNAQGTVVDFNVNNDWETFLPGDALVLRDPSTSYLGVMLRIAMFDPSTIDIAGDKFSTADVMFAEESNARCDVSDIAQAFVVATRAITLYSGAKYSISIVLISRKSNAGPVMVALFNPARHFKKI